MSEIKETRKVLGRGISSLIPGAKSKPATPAQAPVVSTAATVVPTPTIIASVPAPTTDNRANEKSLFVEIDRIRMNPRQPRKTFEEKALNDLIQSVKEKGVLQPLLVCRKGMHYELIAGERRYRASKEAGLKVVPVRILETNDQEQLEIALIENLIRSDLNPIEEAKGYEKLQKEFNLTHEQISQKVSKDRTTVTNALRLLKLPLVVQQELQRGNLSMGHARALLSLEKEHAQLELVREILATGLSVRQTEKRVSQLNAPKKPTLVAKRENPNVAFVREEIQRKLGPKVEIKEKSAGKGEIRIQYFSNVDLTRIVDLLKNI
ncbi:MAG: ParB/RepB/Spo0J family partition protein [Proteobacteria bacterium]|nr:ParB/RepB/Spo0J family partition protein [Pseudomonadota bacterium]